jgi:hypothetical protein
VDFKKRTIMVQGEKIEIDLDESGLTIADLSEDMGRVASQMAWWSSVLSAAEAEKIRVDGFYRQWRAKTALAALDKDPKLSEYKQKLAVEASDDFLRWKDKIAISEENAVIAKGMVQAFDKKGSMLQSRGAIIRGELAATGMTTPAVPKTGADWVSGGAEAAEEAAATKTQSGMRKTRTKATTSNGETEDRAAINRAASHLRSLKLGSTKTEVQEAS